MYKKTHFVGGSGVGEVEYLDVALGGSHYHQRILHIHTVTAFRELHSRNWGWWSQVPILHGWHYSQKGELGWKKNGDTTPPTLIVLSQLPVASIPPCGASIHLTTLTGASCWATCCDVPVVMSNMRAALSAPPDNTLFPSWRECQLWNCGNNRKDAPCSSTHSRQVLDESTWPCLASVHSPQPRRCEPISWYINQ